MTKLFYLSEVLEFAIAKEEESLALYQKLFEVAKSTEAKELFQTLIGEEKKHKAFYTDMLNDIPKERSPGPQEPEEHDLYIKELIASSRSAKFPDLTRLVQDIKQAIAFAIEREKDSILLYVGLKNYVPEEHRNTVDTIIREEARHMAKLVGMKFTL